MQAGAFIPRMLKQARLLETSDDILDLNVILVYKKLVCRGSSTLRPTATNTSDSMPTRKSKWSN